MKIFLNPIGVILFVFATSCSSSQNDTALFLHYTAPAQNLQNDTAGINFFGDATQVKQKNQWESHALPIGNGRLGAMIFGGEKTEIIQFNVDSLWTGDANPSGDYATMGAYQNFGEFRVHFSTENSPKNDTYHRSLNIENGIHRVEYINDTDGAKILRETFASAPENVIIMRVSADQKNVFTGVISLLGAHSEITKISKENDTAGDLFFEGKLSNNLTYTARLKILCEDGKLSLNDSALNFENATALTFILAAETDYFPDVKQDWKTVETPQARTEKQIANATAKLSNYNAVKIAAENDTGSFMKRVTLSLGMTPIERKTLTTDERISRYNEDKNDPELEALLFQYGRYLLQASSRPGTLPANLQGIWNNSNTPPWSSDYHTNINIQMNYWLAEVANLSDCHTAFFDLMKSQIPVWKSATAAAAANGTFESNVVFKKGVPGWALRTSHNIHGGNGWRWDETANAWYCLHLWEHFAFTNDTDFLRDTAFPIMREICDFWEMQLKVLPDGKLVIPQGWSPEHGPVEDGCSYNQEIVWDLFNNTAEAAKILNINDTDFREKIIALRDALLTPEIGKWGQLKEWMTDRDDPKDNHRHTSHLFAVYPGRQISPKMTPELARAAAVSLEARGSVGDSRRSWTWPWRAALWARLGEPEKARDQILGLFKYNLLPNLFTTHPPFQIDGNLGYTAAVCEMLLQSQNGEIVLLPALPGDWKNGTVRGLRARGGFIVDINWENGKLTDAVIYSTSDVEGVISYDGKILRMPMKKGKSCKVFPHLFTP